MQVTCKAGCRGVTLGSRLETRPWLGTAWRSQWAQALTFGLLQQGRDAVGVHGSLAQLHQGQEEGLQRGVQRLQQGEAQAQALNGHICRVWGLGGQGVGLGSQLSKAESPVVNKGLVVPLTMRATGRGGQFKWRFPQGTLPLGPRDAACWGACPHLPEPVLAEAEGDPGPARQEALVLQAQGPLSLSLGCILYYF